MNMNADSRLMVVDDDEALRGQLGRALTKRGFEVILAGSYAEALDMGAQHSPRYALVDMRLGDGNGLELVNELRERDKDMRIVMFTGFGNIASVVSAIKSGAIDYLPKPADADQIASALTARSDAPLPPPPDNPMAAERVRWEHICRIYEQCNHNVSETARRLRMHRRTLQRILQKYAPRG